MNSIKYNALLLLFPSTLFALPNTPELDSPASTAVDQTLAMLGSESLYLDELPVVISATRLAQPLNESPVSTSVIDRQMIDASGAQTIADLLRLVPGFTVGYIAGNYPVATYHGQSERYSKRIQLVIDGRSVYLPTLSGVSWSDLIISMDDIERIEVSRGPNASTYGNNAFLAVVSITTRHAADTNGQLVKLTAGSHDTADALYRYSGQYGDMDYRITLGTKNNSGTDLLYDSTETDFISYRLDYQLGINTSLFYQGGIQDSIYGDVLESSGDTDNDVDVATAFQHFKLEHNFNNINSMTFQYYYNLTRSYESSYSSTVDGSAFGLDSFDIVDTVRLESERHDLEATFYTQPTDALRLVTGGSVRLDQVGANNVFDEDADNTLMLYRGYTHGEYNINQKLFINAGIMLEKNDISGTDVSPRLSIIMHPNHQHSFRMGISKATRTPVLFDEVGHFGLDQTLTRNGGDPLPANDPVRILLGDDRLVDVGIFSPNSEECEAINIPTSSCGLESEEIVSLEFGWMMRLLDNSLLFDLKLYSDKTSQLIAFIDQDFDVPGENIDDLNTGLGIPIDPNAPGYDKNNIIGSPGAAYADNAAETRIRGLEMYLDYRINPQWRVYSYFAYTKLSAQNTNPLAHSSIAGKLGESAPRRSYGAMLMKKWPANIDTSLAVYHVSDMDWIDRTHNRDNPVGSEFTDRSAEKYTKIDFVFRKFHPFSDSQLSYSFILQNIGGTHHDYSRTDFTDNTYQNVNVPGSRQDTRGYFELAYKFN